MLRFVHCCDCDHFWCYNGPISVAMLLRIPIIKKNPIILKKTHWNNNNKPSNPVFLLLKKHNYSKKEILFRPSCWCLFYRRARFTIYRKQNSKICFSLINTSIKRILTYVLNKKSTAHSKIMKYHSTILNYLTLSTRKLHTFSFKIFLKLRKRRTWEDDDYAIKFCTIWETWGILRTTFVQRF